MSGRIQVIPYDEFGRDVSWISQELIEGYIYAWIKGERYAKAFVVKYAQADPTRIRTFEEVLSNDADFDDLKEQIWDEMELPAPGSIQYHIWQIERRLEDPALPPTELAKLYKILGEYNGWIAKPGESKVTVNMNSDGGKVDFATLNDRDAELLYMNMLGGR